MRAIYHKQVISRQLRPRENAPLIHRIDIMRPFIFRISMDLHAADEDEKLHSDQIFQVHERRFNSQLEIQERKGDHHILDPGYISLEYSLQLVEMRSADFHAFIKARKGIVKPHESLIDDSKPGTPCAPLQRSPSRQIYFAHKRSAAALADCC